MPKSISNLKLIHQASELLAGARRDCRDAADDYRAKVNTQWTLTHTADQTRRQGVALVLLLDKIAANSTIIQAACVEWDVDYADLVDSYTKIRNAAIAMRDAATDGSNVVVRLDAIIAGLPRGDLIY